MGLVERDKLLRTWGPGVVVFALGGGILLTAWYLRPRPEPQPPAKVDPVVSKVESAPVVAPRPPAPPPALSLKEQSLQHWRKAILSKNARAVSDLERAFRAEPESFREPLMKLAEGDTEPRVRSFSTRLLGNMGRKDCFDLFVKLLEKDPDRYVRQNAAWALGQLGMAEAGPALSRALGGDAEENVRTAAGDAMKKLK